MKNYEKVNIDDYKLADSDIVMQRPTIYPRYYIYMFRNKINGEVFYVGKGKEMRAKDFDSRNELVKVYMHIINHNFDVLYVNSEPLTEGEALAFEAAVIRSRKPICNIQNPSIKMPTDKYNADQLTLFKINAA